MRNSVSALVVLCLLGSGVGCQNTPARVAAPGWEPEKNADDAMAALDKDQDGALTNAELDAAPGLKWAAATMDKNGDQQLSRDEIRERFALYRDMKVGLKDFTCMVSYKGRLLNDAEVRFVPEPFLADIIEPATGTTMDGVAQLTAEGSDFPAVRIGMYRVEITSPHVEIPAKYNTQTELGIEVSPVTDPRAEGTVPFQLK